MMKPKSGGVIQTITSRFRPHSTGVWPSTMTSYFTKDSCSRCQNFRFGNLTAFGNMWTLQRSWLPMHWKSWRNVNPTKIRFLWISTKGKPLWFEKFKLLVSVGSQQKACRANKSMSGGNYSMSAPTCWSALGKTLLAVVWGKTKFNWSTCIMCAVLFQLEEEPSLWWNRPHTCWQSWPVRLLTSAVPWMPLSLQQVWLDQVWHGMSVQPAMVLFRDWNRRNRPDIDISRAIATAITLTHILALPGPNSTTV